MQALEGSIVYGLGDVNMISDNLCVYDWMSELMCLFVYMYLSFSRRYREYAFVRTEEEREQFLYHLLTLTARDFSCFTTGFHGGSKGHNMAVCVGEGISSLSVNLYHSHT